MQAAMAFRPVEDPPMQRPDNRPEHNHRWAILGVGSVIWLVRLAHAGTVTNRGLHGPTIDDCPGVTQAVSDRQMRRNIRMFIRLD